MSEYRRVLDLVAEVLRRVSTEFPDKAVTGFLRETFDAEFALAVDVDLCGGASRHWAESPYVIQVDPGEFHTSVVRHSLARVYARTGALVPLRLSDVASARDVRPACEGTGLSRVLAIPLTVSPARIRAVVLARGGADFTDHDLWLAGQLQPVLGGIDTLRARLGAADTAQRPAAPAGANGPSSAAGADRCLTAREAAVLDLMAGGLITEAIARQLCISPHTVSKHVESIYRKFGTHDRASAILRGQALGLLRPPSAAR